MTDKDRKPSASFVPFRPLDNLFEPTVQGKPEVGSISQIAIGELFPFKDHPFLPYTEERMQEMVESVKEYGIMSPIIARPRKEGGYGLGLSIAKELLKQMDEEIWVTSEKGVGTEFSFTIHRQATTEE